LKIDSVISGDKEYLLRLFGQHYDIIAIFARNKIGIIPGSPAFIGGILRIENGEIIDGIYYPQELMEIKTRHIETLEIISDNPENTEFLNELIELVKGEEEEEEIVFSCVPSKI
jgi:hypothetical protein